MFTVAPSGRTKLAIFFETPRFSSAIWIVTGRVALELEVEKPSSCALRMRRKNSRGLSRARNFRMNENVPKACSKRPNATVPVYHSRLWRISKPNRAVTPAINTKTAYGANTMIQRMSCIEMSFTPSKNPRTALRRSSRIVVAAMPKRMLNRIRGSISVLAAALIGFLGIIFSSSSTIPGACCARSILPAASPPYSASSPCRDASLRPLPGLITFERIRPMLTATEVVMR